VIDGVKKQNTEQRVTNSPRQPASEGKERGCCGSGEEEEEEEGGD